MTVWLIALLAFAPACLGRPLDQLAILQDIQSAYNGSAFEITESGQVQIKLCECERASGAPNGLSCDKTGWFVSSWERQGQWVTPFSLVGGGIVPLSHAICCRPCLPTELPADDSGRVPAGQQPVAVISLACHTSTNDPSDHCERDGESFVAGFSESVQVFAAIDTHYPVNAARCCTPSLLLPNGDAWELERCDCVDAEVMGEPSPSCGGVASGRLLAGFTEYRETPLAQLVPIAPAHCCGVCVSERFHPMSSCDDLNNCSRRGVCNLGACDCFAGWMGPDCSLPDGRHAGSKPVPGWAIALIILSSIAIACTLALMFSQLLNNLDETMGFNGSQQTSAETQQPLLLRIDPDDAGNVGSTDTESDLSGDEDGRVEERIGEAIRTVNAGLVSGAPDDSGVTQQQEQDGARTTPLPSASETSTNNPDQGDEEDELIAKRRTPEAEDAASSPQSLLLAGKDCSVCMVREVQVVLVPCGHICLCRRCSRRLQRCPICRKEIVRRQRLFI